MKNTVGKSPAEGQVKAKKSAVQRLFVANILVFLFLLIALSLVLWALGLWNSILTFLF